MIALQTELQQTLVQKWQTLLEDFLKTVNVGKILQTLKIEWD
jgi:hypothetical protein